jgi:hypothetical protein
MPCASRRTSTAASRAATLTSPLVCGIGRRIMPTATIPTTTMATTISAERARTVRVINVRRATLRD